MKWLTGIAAPLWRCHIRRPYRSACYLLRRQFVHRRKFETVNIYYVYGNQSDSQCSARDVDHNPSVLRGHCYVQHS